MSAAKSHSITKEDCVLLVVDIQERLLPAIHDGERATSQSVKLIQGAKALGVPIVWTEQYRKGLGDTAPSVKEAIGDAAEPLEKLAFGCLQDETINQRVKSFGRGTLILCGIETHICVMQTAMKALDDGMRVVLAEDAVSSRRPEDRAAGIARMYREGVIPATVESLIMEWTGAAGTETFKKILPIIK